MLKYEDFRQENGLPEKLSVILGPSEVANIKVIYFFFENANNIKFNLTKYEKKTNHKTAGHCRWSVLFNTMLINTHHKVRNWQVISSYD